MGFPGAVVVKESAWECRRCKRHSFNPWVRKIPWSCCCCCSVAKSGLCNPIDCSTPGYLVLHYLLEFAQTHVYWVSDTIEPSYPVASFSFCHQSFPASASFSVSQLFASGGQTTGASASASVLPMNIQDGFPLALIGWISLQSKGLSRVFFITKVQKHQFFGAQFAL